MSTELYVKHIPPTRWWKASKWELTKPLVVLGHVVPAGFITDGASVPRLFWRLFPPMGRYSRAAILHDHTEDDQLFLEAMLFLGVGKWRAYIMYWAVFAKTWFKKIWK